MRRFFILRSVLFFTRPRLALMLLQKYAIAEFDIPYSASRAKKALDQIENSMKPDQNKRGGGSATQVKLLRSEFAAIKSVQSQFSKILFVSNLPPVRLLPCLGHPWQL